jgi:hypothetical protein
MAGRTSEPDDEREPTPEPDDIDVRFAEITASLGDLTVPPADGTHARLDEGPDTPEHGPRGRGPAPSSEVSEPPDDEPGEDADDDEPGFVPEEPAPMTGGDPVLVVGWVGLVGSVAVVLVYLMIWRGMPGALVGLAGVAFVLSVGVLVWRLPGRRDPDDHDDGAVV